MDYLWKCYFLPVRGIEKSLTHFLGDEPVSKKKRPPAGSSGNGYFGALEEQGSDFIYIIDGDMVLRGASESFARLFGFSPAELVGKSLADIAPDTELYEKRLREDRRVLETGESLRFTETLIDERGAERYILRSKYPVMGKDGRPDRVLSVARDVTGAYAAREDYLKEIQYLLRIKDDAYGAWLLDLTAWSIVEYRPNPATRERIARKDSIDDYLKYALKSLEDNDDARDFLRSFSPDTMLSMYRSGRRKADFEYRLVREDGRQRWVQLIVRLLLDPITSHLMAVVTLTDINSAKSAQSELIKAAEIDSMTGVLNHDATLGHIGRFLEGEGAGGSHALLMVDRDGLKNINDTFGHQTGDDIIIETARVLRGVFRDSDIIGRVGGDEFLILMKNIGKPSLLRRKAAELLQSLQCICGPADNAVESTGSVGVSFYEGDGKTLDKLYAEADRALYKAKSEGRNRVVIYSGGDLETAVDERDSLMDTINLRTLLNSIDGGILILHAEPGKQLLPVFFSDSFLTMMGGITQKEAFELYGESIFERIHPDESERVRMEYAGALESGEPLRTTYRLAGKDGRYHWLSAGANITKDAEGRVDVYTVHTNIEKLMHREQQLASDEQRFRMAFAQTSRMLCELDIATDSLVVYARDGKSHVPESVVTDLPESIIESGFIHERSAEAFKSFYEAVKSGKLSSDTGLFKCRYFSSGQYGWTAFSFETVCDAEGRLVKAVGSIEEMPNIGREQDRMEREERLLAAVKDDLIVGMKVSLTEDAVEYSLAVEDSEFRQAAGESYSAFTKALFSASPFPEDAMLLQLNMSAESLNEAHNSGQTWKSVEFRRVDGGEIRWTKISAVLASDPLSRRSFAFIYISDVEKRRGLEALLPVVVESDPATHIYTQSTTEKLVDSLLRGSVGLDKQYSLALIRMVGLPSLSARVGAERVDLEKMYLSRFLSALLEGDCIVGRYNVDCILVFCPDAQSDEWMRDRISAAVERLNALRSADKPEERIKLICGVATEQARGADFSGMLAQATRVCDNFQNAEGDGVYSFIQYVDSFRLSEEALEKSAFISFDAQELNRPLFGAEREALSDCMSVMLAADSYDSSISGALGVIGKYYNAQRVYTLNLLEGGASVTGLHEWVAAGRHSTLRQMAGMPLDKLPMFKRTLTAAKPILLDGRSRRISGGPEREGDNPWRFISIPIISEGRVQGFMCIENPERHMSEVALPCALLPILLHERARFGVNAAGIRVAGRDALTGLSDRASYENAVQSFNPDAYHAVGVLYLSVVNLRELNRVNGVLYGDEMLVFAAQTLTGIIKKAQIYRMSGPEFLVVSTNLSRETFQAQCARVRSVLQRRYPKGFVFGEAWSNKNLSVRKLLTTAEMLAHSGEERSLLSVAHRSRENGMSADVKAGLAEGRFYILLQPQVDMRSGRIIGSEALARYRDGGGRVILPSEFIRSFEEAGSIRELDYFVLDQAFSSLQNWLDAGLKPLPISVNFSRQTLMSATLLASALAIRSRYDVPDDLVEIEITESVGDYEADSLREIMDEMCRYGFRFALDDLGSEYSSLKTLGDLSFDAVKLDKSLIGSLLYNTLSRSVAESIVTLCAKNDIRCVAEGVESELHVKCLLDAGCIYAQGYYYGKPMTVEDFAKKFLKK